MAGHQRKLTPQQILDAALELIEKEGVEQLSMRRLGSSLGVEAMSLYNHFRNKSDLLDGMQARLLERMPAPSTWAQEGGWRSQAQRAARDFRSLLKDNPQAIPLLANRAAATRGSLAFFDAAVRVFLAAGRSPAESLRAFHTLFTFMIGHAVFHFRPSADQDPDLASNLYRDYRGLAQLTDLEPYDEEAEFEFGLGLLLDGLERMG